MKKLIALLFVCLTIVGLSACVSNHDDIPNETICETIPIDDYESPTPPAPPEQSETNPTINSDDIRVG